MTCCEAAGASDPFKRFDGKTGRIIIHQKTDSITESKSPDPHPKEKKLSSWHIPKPEIPAQELVLYYYRFFEVQNTTALLLSCNNCQFGLWFRTAGPVASKKGVTNGYVFQRYLFVPPLSRSCEQRSVIKQLTIWHLRHGVGKGLQMSHLTYWRKSELRIFDLTYLQVCLRWLG